MDTNTEALLRELAEKLGTTTEKLYGVLVKQSKIWGIRSCLMLLFWIIGLIAGVVLLNHLSYKPNDREEINFMNVAFFVGWVINIVGWIASLEQIPSHISDIIQYFTNPEYAAIQEISDFFKKD